ncbi:MAG: hypothetical protein WC810_14650 [Janthinobacterium sp.]|jgi:hypothetical protein
MKELETHLKLDNQERIELSVKKKQEIEYVLQGTIKPQTGHFVWELNEETGEIKKAEFKRNTAVYGAELPPEELVVKADCIYIPALNAENAKRKYLKNKEQSAYYVKPAPMSLSDLSFK